MLVNPILVIISITLILFVLFFYLVNRPKKPCLLYTSQRCGPGHSWGPAMRDYYLIHYITSGSGIYDNGKKVYHLSSGDGFLVTPSCIVSYLSLIHIWVLFP